MKRILSLYIIREISSLFLLGIVIFTLVLLLGRLISLTDMVVSRGVPFFEVLRMILFLLPSFLVFTIPMAFLLSVLLSFSRLSADNELTVIKSCGISLYQMMPPVLLCSFLATLWAFQVSLVAVPWGNSAFKQLSFELLKGNASATIKEKTFWDDIPGFVMYADRYEEQQRRLKGVVIHDGRNQERPLTIFAKEGVVISPNSGSALLMTLYNGSIHTTASGGAYRLVSFGEYEMLVGDKGVGGQVSRSELDMRPEELKEQIANTEVGISQRLKLEAELYSRYSLPLASVVFAILAVPLGMQNRRSGKGAGFTLSIVVIISYYVIMSIMRSVAERDIITPAFALWMPNALFLVAGLLLLQMASREVSFPSFSLNKSLKRLGRVK